MKNLKAITCIMLILFGLFNCARDLEIDISPPVLKASKGTYSLKVALSWTPLKGVKSYQLFRTDYVSTSNPGNLNFVLVGEISDTTFTDLKVTSGSRYYYRVAGVYPNGQKTMSSQVEEGYTKVLTADDAFTEIGSQTGGKRYDAPGAKEVPKVILDIINQNAQPNSDIIFLIDNTGSMGDDISEVKSSLNSIISKLPAGTRLGMATYNDNNYDTNWYHFSDLNTDYTIARSFLNAINVYGGGDTPESVYDGIYETVNRASWSSKTKRFIIVIGDAPPQEGSRSQKSFDQVINICLAKGLTVNLYPILIK
ncbi:vWA domain-containing protein [Pseudarcicella hirudinis]|nr:vWA domain-containing protein [Pseudarcicella hirudinis]